MAAGAIYQSQGWLALSKKGNNTMNQPNFAQETHDEFNDRELRESMPGCKRMACLVLMFVGAALILPLWSVLA